MKFSSMPKSLLIVAASFSTAAFAEEAAAPAAAPAPAPATAPAKPPVELHGYIHLKLTTAPNLGDYTPSYDSYWNTMGREGSRMGWIRLAPTFNLANDARLVMELESTADAFNNISDTPFDFTRGSAYLELPVSSETKVWFGRRRFELNQQRWSDGKPFNPNPDRLNGGGIETKVNDIQLSSTLAIAPNDNQVTYKIPDPDDATKKIDQKIALNKLIFIQQASVNIGTNASLSPLLIVDYVGKNSKLEEARDAVKDAGNSKADSEADQRVNVQAAVSYTSWGEGWWNNAFAGLATQNARTGTTGGSQKVGRNDKDTVMKVGTQGGYNALAQSARIGLYYGGRVDVLSYKNNMQQMKIKDDVLVADGSKKTKQGFIAAGSVQPIYYVTDKVHGAFDVTYTHRSLVNDGTSGNPSVACLPSALALSPIIRYATKAEPIALPQIYAGVTYTSFNAKHPWLTNAKGKNIKELTTFQAGLEADF